MTEGQCLCGRVRYELSGSLGEVRYCHCSRCRRATGSAFSANARIASVSFRMVSGRDGIREYEERPGIFRAFCSVCGSPVYARLDRDPTGIRVRLGGLSGEVDARITAHVWVSSKSSWYQIADSLPCYAESVDESRTGGSRMKRLARRAGLVLAIVAAIVAAIAGAAFLLIETGEVIVLRNSDAAGQTFETRLWVVDHEGVPWISTGNTSKAWFVRVRANPRVELVRGGEVSCRDAVVLDDAPTRERVRGLFQEKYRVQLYGATFLNRLFAPFGAQGEPGVVRLEPCRRDGVP